MKLDIKEKIDAAYGVDDTEFPIDILQKAAKNINDQLDDVVTVTVKEYNKPIESYETYGLTTALAGITANRYINIQDQLGEKGEINFKYEVVFESTYLPDYKYRLMFVGNNIAGYPAKIVLDEGVAEDINNGVEADYTIEVKDSKSFEKYVECIFNSESVIKILANIFKAVNRQRRLRDEKSIE